MAHKPVIVEVYADKGIAGRRWPTAVSTTVIKTLEDFAKQGKLGDAKNGFSKAYDGLLTTDK